MERKSAIDMERVIGHLNDCMEASRRDNTWVFVRKDIVEDVLVLLKEQDEKPMTENETGWNCPSCGLKLIGKTASGYPCDLIDLPLNFCPRCGQEVKWE